MIKFLIPLLFIFELNANCLVNFEKFITTSKGYKLTLNKIENFKELKVENKNILAIERYFGKSLKMTFLDVGVSGIKNNGMVLTYTGGDSLKAKLGKTGGISFFSGLVSKISDEHKLYGSFAMKNELFTLNRAGLDFIYDSLFSKKLKPFNITKNDNHCTVSSLGKEIAFTDYSYKGEARKVEDKFKIPLFLIYAYNLEKYNSLAKFIKAPYPESIKIPDFIHFELDLMNNGLPKEYRIFFKGKNVAKYSFSDVLIL